ncbi:hypothetical protein ABZP36_027180 [Zizania latifolia]
MIKIHHGGGSYQVYALKRNLHRGRKTPRDGGPRHAPPSTPPDLWNTRAQQGMGSHGTRDTSHAPGGTSRFHPTDSSQTQLQTARSAVAAAAAKRGPAAALGEIRRLGRVSHQLRHSSNSLCNHSPDKHQPSTTTRHSTDHPRAGAATELDNLVRRRAPFTLALMATSSRARLGASAPPPPVAAAGLRWETRSGREAAPGWYI